MEFLSKVFVMFFPFGFSVHNDSLFLTRSWLKAPTHCSEFVSFSSAVLITAQQVHQNSNDTRTTNQNECHFGVVAAIMNGYQEAEKKNHSARSLLVFAIITFANQQRSHNNHINSLLLQRPNCVMIPNHKKLSQPRSEDEKKNNSKNKTEQKYYSLFIRCPSKWSKDNVTIRAYELNVRCWCRLLLFII